MEKTETISLYEFFKKFPNEEAARLYFEEKRWSVLNPVLIVVV
jgi:hypothetical protein